MNCYVLNASLPGSIWVEQALFEQLVGKQQDELLVLNGSFPGYILSWTCPLWSACRHLYVSIGQVEESPGMQFPFGWGRQSAAQAGLWQTQITLLLGWEPTRYAALDFVLLKYIVVDQGYKV